LEQQKIPSQIGKRLKQEMKKRTLTSTELARRSGVLTSFLYDIISGKSTNPSTVKLARVADALGINLNQLISSADEGAGVVAHISAGDYVAIPKISSDGTVLQADGQGACLFNKKWIALNLAVNVADLRAFTIDGDSMTPSLCRNDLVLVDVSKKQPSPPAIFVLFDGVGLVAKRCEYITETSIIRISSDNSHYASYEKPSDEIAIVGRVIWFSRTI
jgi:phage repressor protein C with HTH and peptisase S24 domain